MTHFHSIGFEKVLKELKTSKEGLVKKEIQKRQEKFGTNSLPKSKPLSKVSIFFEQFNNVLIFILLIAGSISFFLEDYIDAAIIFGAIIINTVIGFIQENKANQALEKLKNLVERKALTLRDGNETEIDSKDLVVGDIVFLSAGNHVPADARIIESNNLQVNEASLTGESMSSNKQSEPVLEGTSLADRESMVYGGTIVTKGTGMAVVTSVGINTEIGKIALLVSETHEEKTPLQERLSKFSAQIGIYITILVFFLIFVGIMQGRELFEMFLTGVALAVAAIPEGLSVAVTVILTIGMQSILKHKALVRKLIATETLGSTTVICTDKTGTLTEGKMHVAHIVIGENEYEIEDVGVRQTPNEAKIVSLALQTAMMCNDAIVKNPLDELNSWSLIGESTDVALLSAALQSGLNKKKHLQIEPKVDELPFDSDQKYMISLHKKGSGYILYEKGAPEIILSKSTHFYHKGKLVKLTVDEKKKIERNYIKLTKKGLRLIAVAHKDFKSLNWEKGKSWDAIDTELVFIGLIALKDPLRPEARETIQIAKKAGIRPIIITGDHKLTAQTIGEEVGICVKADRIMNGDELDSIGDEELEKLVKKIDIYARVSPRHKLRIVKALKRNGEVVAMTGDGVNDSPALKAADIGVSVGTGTDIAKETSDLVLLDDNFKTIVNAVKQGRVIFSNIRKVITFLLSDTFSQMILIAGSILFGFPLALIPAQILWMNIVQDGLPDFALAFEKDETDVMSERPISRNEPILNNEMKVIIFIVGVLRDFFILLAFIYMLGMSVDIDYVRTFVFAAIATNSLMNIFSIRALSKPIWKVNPFSNKYLIIAIGVSFLLLLGGVYFVPLQFILTTVPLTLNAWFLIFGISIVTIILIEVVKYIFVYKKKEAQYV